MIRGVVEDLPEFTSLRIRDWIRAHIPFLLKRPLLLENWQWLGLFGIILLGMLFSRLVVFFMLLLTFIWFVLLTCTAERFGVGVERAQGADHVVVRHAKLVDPPAAQ